MKPQRVQLSRAKGWRMPPGTVKIDRSSCWGNPYRVEEDRTAQQAVQAFETWLQTTAEGRALAERAKVTLKGKNLACWCKLDAPCHGDVWLRVVNGEGVPS